MEKLEDAKRVIRNRNSWKDRQCNVKRETKNKWTNNDLQKKQKDRSTRAPFITGKGSHTLTSLTMTGT
jgi:hypothetical protein